MASTQQQVVVVTGAAGFIGSRCCAAFAAAGADVAGLDLVDPAAATASVCEQGREALTVQADLADADQVRDCFARVLDWKGRIDVLVNMAGLYYKIPRIPFWEIDIETWNSMVANNLRTAFLCAQAAAPHMRDAGRGRIVNVSSNTAVFGMANFMHYNAAKAGIVGMTRGMARELGPFGIAVNAVAPGLVRTQGGVEALAPEYWDQVVAGQCLRSPIEVDDVVEAVTFLGSDRSRMITGQTLLVNGGASMGSF